VRELLKEMRLLNENHAPDGWPAVRMSEINELINMIEQLNQRCEMLYADNQGLRDKLTAHEKTIVNLSDALVEANERVKELEQESAENLSIIESIAEGLSENPVSLCKGVMQGRDGILNKFALEHWIEAIEVFTDSFIEANYKHETPLLGRKYNDKMRGALLNALKKSSEKTCEQLRKGGES
jgi:predicted S18 family serine protease